MLVGLTPLYSMDGDIGSSDGWSGLFTSAEASDEQPYVDSDADIDVETDELSEQDTEHEESEESDTPEADEDPDVDIGEGRQPVKMSELKQGYMRQSDYTKKTQELATQRKEVESLQEAVKPAQEWLQHMESNPWLWQQFNNALQEWNQTGTLPLDEVLQDAHHGKYINHLMGEVNRLNKELESANGELGTVKLSSSIQSLKTDLIAEYGDLVTDEYMQQLQDRAKAENLSSATLQEIADGHLAKQKLQQTQTSTKKATKQAEAKTIQNLQEKRQSSPHNPSRTGQKPSVPTKSVEDMSWGELFKSKG